MNLEKTTFTFRAELGRSLPWDALTQIGQTVKVIFTPQKGFSSVRNSAWHWTRRCGDRRLKLILRAQTFAIFELCHPETDEEKKAEDLRISAERKARHEMRLKDRRQKAWERLTERLKELKVRS